MSAGPIQDDYGGFDPTFIGVTLRMWPRTWDLFQKVNVMDRDPAEVVRIGNEALAGDADQAFEVFCAGTVLIHELRHFHDFILSPFGNQILRRRIVAAVNGFNILGHLTRNEGLVPVPIPKWRRMERPKQLAYLDQWRSMLETAPDEADFDLTGETRLALEQVEKAYAGIKNLVAAPQRSATIAYHPYHVLEASAIAVQLNNVYTVFGADHADLFLNRMLNSPEAADYALVLRGWCALYAHADRPIDLALLSAAVTWSLLGDYETEGWDACPTVRFALLFALLKREGLPDFDEPAADLMNRWSEKTGTVPVLDGLRRASAANRRLRTKLSDFARTKEAKSTAIVAAFDSFMRMQEQMTDLFEANADLYVRPHLYAEQENNWVAAPIRLDFPNLPLVGDRRHFKRSLNVRVAQEVADGRLAVRRALLPGQTPGRKMMDGETAATACDMMTMIDFFFAEFRRDEPDFDVTRQVIAGEGMCAMEIL